VSDALEPTPTALDRRVLEALPRRRPGLRARGVAARVYPRRRTAAQVDEVRRILRGFEHLGHARQLAGWWSR
jgi:hypothetical protein